MVVDARLVVGHTILGSVFIAQGVWHLYNSISTLTAGHTQQERPWHPVHSKQLKCSGASRILWHAELHVLLWGSLLFLAFALYNVLIDGHGNVSVLISNMEHASLILFILFYAAAAMAAEPIISTRHHTSASLLALLHFLYALAFAHAALLIHGHAASPVIEVENHYHWLWQLAMAALSASSLLRIMLPQSFLVAFARSLAMVMLGGWSFLIGILLWVPFFAPLGCKSTMVTTFITKPRPTIVCDSSSATLRATMLATQQFSCLLAVVVGFSVAYLIFALHLGLPEEPNQCTTLSSQSKSESQTFSGHLHPQSEEAQGLL